MTRTLRRTLAVVLPLVASTLLVPAAQAATPVDRVVWDNGPGGERYVALGDSFTSGPGIAPQREGCSRSEKNFPSLVAAALDVTAFSDASCGGATTAHFTASQTSGGYTNAPQLDALSEETTLVTFGTMGGNDIGLVALASGCLFADCLPAAGTDPLAAQFSAVRLSLAKGIDAVKSRAPSAEIVIVGYGTYLPPTGCPTVIGGVTAAEATYVQSQIDRLSDTLKTVAAVKGVTFADMRKIPGAAEHTACAQAQKQWIRAINTYDDGAVLHPSACGMDATAQQVLRTLQQVHGETVTPFDDSCVSAGPAPDPEPEPPVVTPPTKAERIAALKAKAATAQLATSCRGARRATQRLTVTVKGGAGTVTAAVFKVGTKTFAVDRKAPFRKTVKAKNLRKRHGKVRAVVTFRDSELKVTRTLTKKRPRCL